MSIKNWVLRQNKGNRDRWVGQIARSVPPGSRVLDLGAGGCPYRSLFQHCEYKTQDFVALKPDQLTQGGYGQIDFVCDAAAIPAKDGAFDVILCTEVLEHVPEPADVVREMARLIRAGGSVYLSAPLGSGLHQEPFHYFGGFTPHWYRRVLSDARFNDIVIEANGGSFMHFSQWCLWFAGATRPWRLPINRFVGVILAPLWLACLPVVGGLFLLSRLLDPLDSVQQFTVGYHVRAVRTVDGEPPK